MSAGLVEHLRELAEPIGGVGFRKMFGGWGIFREGRMFGLVADDVAYLKVDAESEPHFLAAGLEPFSYHAKGGKPMQMGYRRIPESALDDPDEFRVWALRGIGAAERAGLGKLPKPKKRATEAGKATKARPAVKS